MEIQSRASWGAKPPLSTAYFVTISGWVVHWVGGAGMAVAPTLSMSQATMRQLQADAFARNYDDFEYNFAVDPVGRIFEGRGWKIKSGANGTSSSNGHEWAVVYIAGPGVPLTNAAKQALLWLTQEGARRVGSVATVRPHRNVVQTQCPGDETALYCSYLNAHLHDTTVAPEPKAKVMFETVDWCYFDHETKGKTCAAVTPKGQVKTLPSDAWQGEPFNNSYWISAATGKPRIPKSIEPNDKHGYTVIATTGEKYNYPA